MHGHAFTLIMALLLSRIDVSLPSDALYFWVSLASTAEGSTGAVQAPSGRGIAVGFRLLRSFLALLTGRVVDRASRRIS